MLATTQSPMLNTSGAFDVSALCLQTANFRRDVVGKSMGGIARTSVGSTTLYTGVNCSLQQASFKEQNEYMRIGRQISHKAFTYPGADGNAFDPTTLLQNDVMTVNAIDYRVKEVRNEGGGNKVFTIFADLVQ